MVLSFSSTMEEDLQVSIPQRLSPWKFVVDRARITAAVATHKYEGAGTEESPYIVTWIPDDPGNPLTWSLTKRWTIAFIAAGSMLSSAFASSAFSGK
jgi:hypothetical protein